MFWAICLSGNDIVFSKKSIIHLIHVIFRGTYWLCHWRLLQKASPRDRIIKTCQQVEVVSIFSKKRMVMAA
ncbi:hypothetical protein PR202_ga17303 [Eleusine coracana subsp. coracana]|uniref:Uncharacterized protein n=1 Tax=Eleusine coracana subsp. coracana TaxID=191504 RepID=A0AAV5CQ04_ELECO|nr:hypothetical protein PR202_ga17303 [Eleusine coracana subsp. coracana]